MKTDSMDWASRVEVRTTRIGQGVFSLRSFRSGQTIGQVVGEMRDDPDYGSRYCVDLGDGLTLEPTAPFRFLNHCCEPNARFWVVPGRRGGRRVQRTGELAPRLIVVATRKIASGEQLTIDYAWPADAAIECLCGAPNCRGWIVCPDELHVLRRATRTLANAGD